MLISIALYSVTAFAPLLNKKLVDLINNKVVKRYKYLFIVFTYLNHSKAAAQLSRKILLYTCENEKFILKLYLLSNKIADININIFIAIDSEI